MRASGEPRRSERCGLPLPACGERSPRFSAAGEGDSPRAQVWVTPPHPNPLPAGGERGQAADAATIVSDFVTREIRWEVLMMQSIEVEGGRLVMAEPDRRGIRCFKGIPYAAPPVG